MQHTIKLHYRNSYRIPVRYLHRAIQRWMNAVTVVVLRFFQNWAARQDVIRFHRLNDDLLADLGLRRTDLIWAERLPLTLNAMQALEERARQRRKNPPLGE